MADLPTFDLAFFRNAVARADDPGPPPKQLRILRKLTAILEVTSGYAPLKVFRGKSTITAREAMDCLSILEAPRPIIGESAAENEVKRLEEWTLLVQGWPKDDAENPSDPAYFMKGKVEQMLSLIIAEHPQGIARTDPLYMLGGDIASLTIGQGVVRPPSDEAASRLAMFYLPLILTITTDVRNPSA
jgi:hypothetical protein